MNTESGSRYAASARALLATLLMFFGLQEGANAQAARSIVPYMQEQLGFDEAQTRAALGVLLVFSRDRLPKPEFDELAKRFPNAELLMDQTRQRGIVTAPLDGTDDYQAALENIGIPQAMAARFGPTVMQFLGDAGYYQERDMLSRVLD